MVTLVGAVLVLAGLANSGRAQLPPPPTMPPFPNPSISLPPPPTMPPPGGSSTTSPPPNMPPPSSSTTSPPPTMPPPTIDTDPIERGIEGIIDQLEQFGDQFAEIIEELREIQERF